MSDLQFWLNKKDWPELEPPGFVFLGRAVLAAGKTRFGSEWSGTEPVARSVSRIPAWPCILKEVQVRDARFALYRATNSAMKHAPIALPPHEIYAPLSEKEHVEAKAIIDKLADDADAALARWKDVRLWLTEAMLNGKLAYAIRAAMGTMTPGKPEWWNVPNAANRFYWCKMPPGGTNSNEIGGGYIFVDHAGLDALLGQSLPTSETVEWRRLAIATASCKAWYHLPAPQAEMMRRFKAVGITNPSVAAQCRALAEMWAESGRPPVTWEAIQQYTQQR